MCTVLYAAADAPLPEMAEETPRRPLSVRAVSGPEESVRAHFTKPHVYFLGAYTGCSCGFKYGQGVAADPRGHASVRALGTYLTMAVASVGPMELYACRDGDQGKPPAKSEVVSPGHFAGEADRFLLAEGWFATVVPPAG